MPSPVQEAAAAEQETHISNAIKETLAPLLSRTHSSTH
uniref:Uncharacterized protein n=1 Tax=Arundo donax TaxID=35708 RepID=A0A0A9BGP9_ARUDO